MNQRKTSKRRRAALLLVMIMVPACLEGCVLGGIIGGAGRLVGGAALGVARGAGAVVRGAGRLLFGSVVGPREFNTSVSETLPGGQQSTAR